MSIRNRALMIGGALVAVVLGGQTLLGNAPWDHKIQLVAYFADSSPLLSGNVVKASGVDVGQITNIELDHGLSRVTMTLDPEALPLHQDVRAVVTTQDLLGERYINLERGNASSPAMQAPYVINVSHTSRVVDLQDVLNAVDTPTATALSALVTDAGEGITNQGGNAARTIAGLKPAMTQVQGLSQVLASQNALLTRLVDSTTPVAASLATGNGKQLDQLVQAATRSLATVAAERTALQSALQQLPTTIANSRAALADLTGVAAPTTRVLRSVRPVTDNLTSISGELQSFSNAADPALASLPPVLAQADKLLAAAAPVVRSLRPASNSLVPSAAAARHLSDVAVSGQSLTNLMEFVKGWSMATSDYDAVSHYFKAMIPLSPGPLTTTAAGLLPGLPVNNLTKNLPIPTSPVVPLPGRSDNPAANPLANLLGSLLSPGTSAGTKAGASSSNPKDSATGLSSTQEKSLLGTLLGGLS